MVNNIEIKTPKEQLLKENKITVTVDKYREWLKKFNGRDTYITKSLFNKDWEGWKDNISCGNRMYNYWNNQYPPLDFAENLITEMLDFEDLFKKYKREYWQHVEKIEQLKKEVEKNTSLNRELTEKIKDLKVELEEAEEGREANLDAIGVGIEFEAREKYLPEIESLKTKLNDKSERLGEFIEWLAKEKVETKKLRAESGTKSERIRKISEELAEERRQKRELYLNTKPLPKIPSKFKILKGKTKTKIQHLIEKTKHKSQELIARIEVKVK